MYPGRQTQKCPRPLNRFDIYPPDRFSKFETKMTAGNGKCLNPTNLPNNTGLWGHYVLPGPVRDKPKKSLRISLINLGPGWDRNGEKGKKQKQEKYRRAKRAQRVVWEGGKGGTTLSPAQNTSRLAIIFFLFSPKRSLVPGYRLMEEPTNSPYNSTQSCFLYWDIMVNKTSYLHQLTNINKFTH